jgi:hypothetical protein
MVENLRTLRPQRDRMPFRLPDEVSLAIEGHLLRWHETAATGGSLFHVVEQIDDDELRLLVRYWANLDSLTDEQVRALGVDWSSAEDRPFFDALVQGVSRALADAGDGFAGLLFEHIGRPVRSVHERCGA